VKKYIVTTTINPPTLATIKYSRIEDWTLIVVGDKKTPHEEYERLNCIYLSPEEQEKKYPNLSKAIGWNSIQRRNIGFVEAYNLGADIVATVDDDNIPYENWGKNVVVGETTEIDIYTTDLGVFDPLSVTEHTSIWHRGYPIELVPMRSAIQYGGKLNRKVLVQADLWDGDPDIDAMARLSQSPIVKFDKIQGPYGSTSISPFNSQNTFLAREVIPYYSVFPYVGRMDDIWGSYVLQHHFPNSVCYNKASVYQDRNVQDLVTNLENEIIGYRHTGNLVRSLDTWEDIVPKETLNYWYAYRELFQ
tara:strand:- start:188 stop:1099 length:912 start_codon:yes stop_codon:yes gene_type:complete